MTYRSKVDWWLVLVLITAILLPVVLRYVESSKGRPVPPLFLPSLVALAIIALTVPTRYTIGSSELTVRAGVMRWKIPFPSIVEVSPTSDPSSGPALSMDRLRIDRSDGGKILISPKDKDGFLNELSARAGLRRLGDHLRRDDAPLSRSLL